MKGILYSALLDRGIPLPKEEVTINKFTRWGKNARYWAIGFVGGYSFGDFSKCEKWEVFEENYSYEKCNGEIQQIQSILLEEKRCENERAAVRACEIWNKASLCTSHAYLAKKRIKPYGLKTLYDKLLIPLMNENGEVVSLQFIAADGQKTFLSGGRKKGCYFVIGNIDSEIIICEGYATGASIYECTGKSIIIAFDSGNLLAVSKSVRKKYPNAKITIAADNDKYSNCNIGLIKAKEAAESISANVTVPEFVDDLTKPTDFNDLHILEGVEKVKEVFSQNKQIHKSLLEGFLLTEDSLSYYDERCKRYVYVSDYIKVVAQTEDMDGRQKTGKLVEFKTRRGQIRRQRIHNAWLSKDGDIMRTLLMDIGLQISTSSKARKRLNEYINYSNPNAYAKFVKISGWHGDGFLTENGYIGNENELIFHQSESEPTGIEVNGSLEEWKQNVSKYCVGNSRLILAVSSAFASILLKPCERENFGIHFVGNSSEGKTSALYVAASVFGSSEYIQSWRSTDNGLEGLAVTHNDMLLILDELFEIDPRKVGEATYMLANGKGKTRATISGEARKKFRWRMGILSTGEVDLATHMAKANQKTYAGQEIRLLHITAKPDAESSGIFETFHDFNTPDIFTNYLKEATSKYYGSAIIEFIKKAIEEKNVLKKYYDDSVVQAINKHLPVGANGQDTRVFRIFFLIGFAGEFATRHKITGWQVGEALSAAVKCFNSWLENKGGIGNQEERHMLAQVKLFFSTYAQVRFQKLYHGKTLDNLPITERAGYVETTEDIYYVFPDYFKRHISNGYNHKTIMKLLVDAGIVETDSNNEYYIRKWINDKQYRMYVFTSKVFE